VKDNDTAARVRERSCSGSVCVQVRRPTVDGDLAVLDDFYGYRRRFADDDDNNNNNNNIVTYRGNV